MFDDARFGISVLDETGKSYRLRNGKHDDAAKSKATGKKDVKGRSMADGERVSPRKTPEPQRRPLSSDG